MAARCENHRRNNPAGDRNRWVNSGILSENQSKYRGMNSIVIHLKNYSTIALNKMFCAVS